jgi:myosin-5
LWHPLNGLDICSKLTLFCLLALIALFCHFCIRCYSLIGISWSFIEFPDNQDILDLIDDKRTGILNILDDLCLLSSSRNTESSFAEAMYKKCVSHPRFSASRKQQTYGRFSIQHYAGSVEYSTQHFFEKKQR